MANPTVTVNRSAPSGVSTFRVGVNYIDQTLEGDATAITSALGILASSVDIVCTHMYLFGPYAAWRSASETEAEMHWDNESGEASNLDIRLDRLVANGNAIAVTIGLCPPWMLPAAGQTTYSYGNKSGGTSTVTVDGLAYCDPGDAATDFAEKFPHPTHIGSADGTDLGDMAELVRRFLVHCYDPSNPTGSRYPHQVIERLQMWNELKGLFGFNGVSNNWDTADLVILYNNVWRTVQTYNASLPAGEPKVLLGGCYAPHPTNQGGLPPVGSQTRLVLSNGSYVDPRSLSASLYWYAHALGHDFVCVDGINTRCNELAAWYLTNLPGLPLIWNEFYSGYFDETTAIEVKRAALAVNLFTAVGAGITSCYLWQPEGRGGLVTSSQFEDQALWSKCVSGGGQPQPTADILSALKAHFPPGTTLYPVTSSDPNLVALASAEKTLIVNTSSGGITVDVS